MQLSCQIKNRETSRRIVDKESGLYEEIENGYSLSSFFGEDEVEEIADYLDLPQIKKRGKLVALTGYGPNSYFVYKGTPMGFEYELLKHLSKEIGVELEIVIVHDMEQIVEMLRKGEGDIIADNLIITKDQEEVIDFTTPLMKTRQVLVQRKPKNWQEISYENVEKSLVRSPSDLIGQTVHVPEESPYYSRLKNLSEEIGGDIIIVPESGETMVEELIMKVADGKIPMTIADETTAMVHSNYFANLDIKTPISFEQRVAWAVREESPLLLQRVNKWISKIKKDGTYQVLFSKYYKERRGVGEMVKCARTSMCGRKISPYDQLISEYAKTIGWDWRLLASVVYQESQFDPTAKSWAGACGLMQLMPGTAQCFGAVNREDPIQSLKAGTKYLSWLEKYWEKKVPDPNERIKFILASYNVGQEHVADAQRLAKKYKRNPQVWDDNVAFFILQKSTEKYCKDPVVKYGYCRGREPFEYVNNILERYEHYKKLIRDVV